MFLNVSHTYPSLLFPVPAPFSLSDLHDFYVRELWPSKPLVPHVHQDKGQCFKSLTKPLVWPPQFPCPAPSPNSPIPQVLSLSSTILNAIFNYSYTWSSQSLISSLPGTSHLPPKTLSPSLAALAAPSPHSWA